MLVNGSPPIAEEPLLPTLLFPDLRGCNRCLTHGEYG